ncbi:hypothetical protein ACHAW6_011194 [Cyclotella cf. meneghiniana]
MAWHCLCRSFSTIVLCLLHDRPIYCANAIGKACIQTVCNIRICHYHCDNGRFVDNAFRKHTEQQQQTLNFCIVNAHFENGIAESVIQDLTESARKQLLDVREK